MKKLEELGISPVPWNVENTNADKFKHVLDRNNMVVVLSAVKTDSALISAAPELYRCLREAVVENCHDCGNLDNEMSAYQDDFVCNNDKCFVKKWRDTLAKAAGEETK